ncbi:hypothetical protein Egran_02716 [Elaphomyces granulatus]|uniref:Uncharacterized protein n=1 Tax=Elaphomyces granulatus TaxID=519963 RepID=A0A232LZC7_9EURO|nr:hypothetical protein Egran_02716 [Elaphomyces granulatus]
MDHEYFPSILKRAFEESAWTEDFPSESDLALQGTTFPLQHFNLPPEGYEVSGDDHEVGKALWFEDRNTFNRERYISTDLTSLFETPNVSSTKAKTGIATLSQHDCPPIQAHRPQFRDDTEQPNRPEIIPSAVAAALTLPTSSNGLRRLSRTEYTVGWICALPKETVPSLLMLDEEHEPVYVELVGKRTRL